MRLGESFSAFLRVIVLLHPEDEGSIIYQNNGNFIQQHNATLEKT
jgi:hypothetical protein